MVRLPTIEMKRGDERVIFNLADVDLRRGEGWSVTDRAYTPQETRIPGGSTTFQHRDAVAARSLGTMPEIGGVRTEPLRAVRASRHRTVISAYWQSFAVQNWVNRLQIIAVREEAVSHDEVEGLAKGALLTWKTLHFYESLPGLGDLAALPPQLPSDRSEVSILSWLSDLATWVQDVTEGCAHYLGWASPESRLRCDPGYVCDYEVADAEVHAGASGHHAEHRRLNQLLRDTASNADGTPAEGGSAAVADPGPTEAPCAGSDAEQDAKTYGTARVPLTAETTDARSRHRPGSAHALVASVLTGLKGSDGFANYSAKELGELIGLPPSTVKSTRAWKAYMHLRRTKTGRTRPPRSCPTVNLDCAEASDATRRRRSSWDDSDEATDESTDEH